MFGKGKEETPVSSYLTIFGRIGKVGLFTNVLFNVGQKTWRDELRKKAVEAPINKRIAENSFHPALAELGQLKFEKIIIGRLSLLSGRVLQSEEEANTFLNGLTSDSWAFGVDSSTLVAAYKKYPVLVWLRLLELADG